MAENDEFPAQECSVPSPWNRKLNEGWRENVWHLVKQIVLRLFPSPLKTRTVQASSHMRLEPRALFSSEEDFTFINGLRGIASLVVFFEHFALPYQPGIIYGYGADSNHGFFQLPIVRLLYGGSAMVAVFFAISGFALSLKPLRSIDNMNWSELANIMISSIFRRGIRLFLPALIASFISMIGAYLGCYNIPFESSVRGFRIPPEYVSDRPQRLLTAFAQLQDWTNFILSRLLYPETWFYFNKQSVALNYGPQFWTLPVEFWSSMFLFLALIGCAKLSKPARFLIFAALSSYALYISRWEVFLFLAGSCTASFVLTRSSRKINSFVVRTSLWMVFSTGLYIASYPDLNGNSTLGYVWMTRLCDSARLWQSIGATQILFAICHERTLQSILATSVCRYLGRISYALYIVHVPILQTWGYALVPAFWTITGQDTEMQKQLGFTLGLLSILPCVLWSADLFCRFVDEPCIRLAKSIERWSFSKRQMSVQTPPIMS
ncbi:acyltransferase family-domain-containing protein [Xylogone sp. PMI_703]|nr:acyltransferase family-domain-containing protein [Xylogone sp. PMI_703]